MASEWPTATIGDVAKIKHGFAFKGEFFTDEVTPNVLVTPGNFAIGGGFQIGKPKYYTGPLPDNYALAEGEVVVTMTDLSKASDTLGYAAKVPVTPGVAYWHNQRIGLLQVTDEQRVYKDWLHYLMRTHEYRAWVVGSASGTTVKHTSPSRIESFSFKLPPLEEQRAIAETLGSLDDRIDNLRQTNATLEAIAAALFKSWFVDFDGVPQEDMQESELGLIPKGWRAGGIYDIVDVRYGAPFASSKFNVVGDGLPLVRIRDLRDEKPGVWTPEVHPKGYLIQPGDIIVGMDGEFRAYLWGGEPAWMNQRICAFHPKQPHCTAFVRNAVMPHLARVEATEVATTVIHLGKGDIDEFRVIVPPDEIATQFAAQCQPLYDRMVVGKQQAAALAALRDTLLPRLISGKLRARKAGIASGRMPMEAAGNTR